jgi:hypothetical protein
MHVAISLGNADVAPVPGITPAHVEHIHLDLVRSLFSRGHVVVYGGDLKPTGLSERLIDLAAEVADDPSEVRQRPETRLRNAVAWPIHLRYTSAEMSAHHLEAVFERFDPPADLRLDAVQRATFVAPDTLEHRLWWSRSLTAMREQLDRTIDARVVVCGRGIGSSGAVPGILEEVMVALRGGTPLFVVGGFGGIAVPIIEALTAGRTSVFTRQAQSAHAPLAEFYAYLDDIGQSDLADFDGMVAALHQAGVAGLRNGLTADENRTLFTSRAWPQVLELLLDGLDRLES